MIVSLSVEVKKKKSLEQKRHKKFQGFPNTSPWKVLKWTDGFTTEIACEKIENGTHGTLCI